MMGRPLAVFSGDRGEEEEERDRRFTTYGQPTMTYPCKPPWDESETFHKTNTVTDYAHPHTDTDWRTLINTECGGGITIEWIGYRGDD